MGAPRPAEAQQRMLGRGSSAGGASEPAAAQGGSSGGLDCKHWCQCFRADAHTSSCLLPNSARRASHEHHRCAVRCAGARASASIHEFRGAAGGGGADQPLRAGAWCVGVGGGWGWGVGGGGGGGRGQGRDHAASSVQEGSEQLASRQAGTEHCSCLGLQACRPITCALVVS